MLTKIPANYNITNDRFAPVRNQAAKASMKPDNTSSPDERDAFDEQQQALIKTDNVLLARME